MTVVAVKSDMKTALRVGTSLNRSCVGMTAGRYLSRTARGSASTRTH